MIISGIYAIVSETISTNNILGTSAVDIELKEYDQNGNDFGEEEQLVMPGDRIKLVTKVHNLGMDCYIRAKIVYKTDNNIVAEQDYIDGDYKTWNQKDGYYYAESILNKNEVIELFNEVIIPSDLSDISSNNRIILNIVVDAIQAKNFNNDWEGIEIKKSVDRSYNIDYDGEFSIIFENNSEDHIKLDGDFFGDANNMVPGDINGEVISITNISNHKNEYFLSIDYDNLTKDELKLLDKMKVTIKNQNGKTIANGSFSNIKNKSLGIYKSKEKDNLTISLYLPEDADNDYSKLLSKVAFRFYINNLDKDSNNPQTGDFRLDASISLFVFSSIGFLIVLFIEKRNDVK